MTTKTAHTLVLWNPHSGSSNKAEAARALLDGADGCRVLETASRRQAGELAAEAARGGVELVIAAGGDGTVNAVAQGLLREASSTRLGILPTGTGNDLSRSLGIPLDPLQAAEWLIEHDESSVRSIDVVDLRTPSDSLAYVNMATGGNTGQFTRQLDDEMKEFWGPLCYLRGTLTVLADLTVYDLTIRVDDGPEERFEALNVFVANGRTSGGGLLVAPQASLEDGLFDVIVVLEGQPIDLAGLAAQFVVGEYLQNDLVVHRQARSLSVRADPTMDFSADGDAVTGEPAEFSVRESALPVVVGSDYGESLPSASTDSSSD